MDCETLVGCCVLNMFKNNRPIRHTFTFTLIVVSSMIHIARVGTDMSIHNPTTFTTPRPLPTFECPRFVRYIHSCGIHVSILPTASALQKYPHTIEIYVNMNVQTTSRQVKTCIQDYNFFSYPCTATQSTPNTLYPAIFLVDGWNKWTQWVKPNKWTKSIKWMK